MIDFTEYSSIGIINITLSVVGMILMVVVILSCAFYRRRRATHKPLIFVAFCELVLQGLIYAQWILFENGLTSLLFYDISIVLIYPIFCITMFSILWYIFAYYEDAQALYKIIWLEKLKRPLLTGFVVSICCMAVYMIPLNSGIFVYFDEYGEEFFTRLIIIPYFLAYLIIIPGIFLIFKNAKVIGMVKSAMLTAYWLVPTLMFISDLTWGINLGAITLVIFIFIMSINFEFQQEGEILTRQAQIAQIEVELSENKSRLMLSQIQPHFLFNSLNVISALCDEDPKLAREATNTFADYLRENVNTINISHPVPFSNELKHVKNYVWLEGLRFPDRVKIEYDIKTTEFEVPTLTVQPIVENAIKHGVCKKDGGGCVWISTAESEDAFLITVKDDGVGFDPAAVNDDGKLHVGIVNVRSRLEIQSRGTMDIESTPGHGTTVTIKIPKKEG